MARRSLFTEADLEAVRQATAEAEARTSGEIVPYVVEQVDDHLEARWAAAALGALLFTLAAELVHHLAGLWGPPLGLWLTLPAWIGATAGYLLAAGVPALARLLIPAGILERRVALRADSAFLHEEVFHTRDRTGILIFLALFEHRAVILADTGIHQAVPQEQWQQMAHDLAEGIRAGRAAAALIETIRRSGELLAEHRLDIRPDDINELPDEPRMRER